MAFKFSIHPDFRCNGQKYTEDTLYSLIEQWISSSEESQKEAAIFFKEWLGDSSTLSLQTSGTTGTPKKITIAKSAMIHSALATGKFLQLQPGDKALCCLPVRYIAGKMMLVRAMVLGLDIDFLAPTQSPLENNSTIYDFVAMVPMQVEASLHQLFNVKKLIIGGAKVPNTLAEKLLLVPTQCYESYSMTETVTHIALKSVAEPYFTVLPEVTIAVDARNCLVINAPKISESTIVTNDMVTLLNEKQFIWNGRVDNVINSGGIKLFPEKIEEKLMPFIHERFFVAGVSDAMLGEKVVLVVEGAQNASKTYNWDSLEKYEKPKAVYYVPKFLETETGKIKRKETLELIG